MGHSQKLAVVGGSHHLWQRPGLEDADDAVFAGVYHSHCRWFLGVYIVTAAVIRNPEIAPSVGESALHRLSHEGIRRLVLVTEMEQAAGGSPQSFVGRSESMVYNLEFLACCKIIYCSFPAFQGIDIVFFSRRMYVHRLWRIDISIQCGGVSEIELLLAGPESDFDAFGRK